MADKLEKNGKKMLKNYFSNIPIQTASTPQQIQKHNLRTISNPTPSSSTPLQHPSNSFLT